MAKSAPALNVENISVAYDGPDVIRDINISVKSGEVFGLMGLNGAGKTTLIKAILGLRTQSAGSIEIFGDHALKKAAKEQLAYLPERFEPPWFLTGMEFLKFSLDLYRQPFDKEFIIERARSVALDPDVLNKRVQTYSKGMRQKLGLLGTALTNCSLLILDEPMSGLDPLARSLVKDMLAKCKANGQTVFLSSHILADMDEMCDRVVLLDQGDIKFTGKPSALKKKTGNKTLERAFLHFVEPKENV